MVVDPAWPHKLWLPTGLRPCGGFTPWSVPAERSDKQILVLATAAVIVAGLMVAAVLLFASGGGGPIKNQPFSAGSAAAVRNQLRDGGPYYVPDPFGKDHSILFALEHGKVVALSNVLPDTTSCRIRWRGSINRFVDCHDDRHVSTDLNRYQVEVPVAGSSKGLLLVDLRKLLPAPG
jgi:hypothetical protein